MVKLLAYLSLMYALVTLVSLPYISPVLYAAFSILQPQHVWFWAFDDISAFKITAGLSLISWVIQANKKNINYDVYKLPISKALIALTFFVNLSDWVASYGGSKTSELVLETFNTIMLMYFCCLPLINNEKAVQYLTYVFIITAVYYGYDANDAYFNNQWSRFTQGRLGGPENGAYNDNNKFALIMVIGFPFLLLGFFHFKNLVVKSVMVLGMVFCLHGIFLTGSRGALLAIGGAVFVCTRVLHFTGFKKAFINLAILGGFVFVVLDQAGGTLSRSTGVVSADRQATEEPVNARILSWTVGMGLIKNHPLFGVGVHRFQTASRIEFPGKSPHVAHNTFITFAVCNGLISGLLYLYTFWASYLMIRKINRHTDNNSIYGYSANSAFAALGGFFIGAIFLDLIIFEPYYFLLMLLTACYVQVLRLEKSSNDKTYGVDGIDESRTVTRVS
jgi:O-antigen ligase